MDNDTKSKVHFIPKVDARMVAGKSSTLHQLKVLCQSQYELLRRRIFRGSLKRWKPRHLERQLFRKIDAQILKVND